MLLGCLVQCWIAGASWSVLLCSMVLPWRLEWNGNASEMEMRRSWFQMEAKRSESRECESEVR